MRRGGAASVEDEGGTDGMSALRTNRAPRCLGCAAQGPGRATIALATALMMCACEPLFFSATLAAEQPPKPDTSRSEASPIKIKAYPLSGFDKSDSSRIRFGSLTWRGGLVLTSDDPRFGGWSGVAIDPDGKRVLAVSDAGTWLSARVSYTGRRITSLEDAVIGPIKARNGGRLKRDRDRDAEALLLSGGTLSKGQVLIAFEQNHRIGAFDIDADGLSPPRRYLPMPREARSMRALKGFEALAEIHAGRQKGSLIAFAEHKLDAQGHHSAWLMRSGRAQRLALKDIGGFDPTDAVGLPNGDVILLERRFRWLEGVKMRLRRIPVAEIAPGAAMSGEVLLEANMSDEIDNMEAVTAHTDARGNTILTLMSDDNFNGFLQRTLILQFALPRDDKLRQARQ